MNKANEQKLERVDQVIEFDFGEEVLPLRSMGNNLPSSGKGFLRRPVGTTRFEDLENGARLM